MSNETKNELFAIVPQALIAHPNIDTADKLIFIYCLAKFQTKLDSGEPWTFSAPSIARGTGLNERTVRRRITKIRKQGVLKLYGCRMNGKRKYNVFTFRPEALDALISTVDRMSVVVANADNGFDEVSKQLRSSTADKLSDKMSDRNKKEEGRELEGRTINNNQENSGLWQQSPPKAIAPKIKVELTLNEKIKQKYCFL